MRESNFIVLIAFLAMQFCYLLRSGAQVTDPTEVRALKTIRSSLNDAIGNLNSWNSGDPCTSIWNGIFCYPTTSNGYLHVQQLQLLKLNLSGSLAPELGVLSQLQILDVMWNKINGTIPKEMGNIKSLKLLLLSGNELSGTLPDEIGYLVNLNRLQIDENFISGPIPKSFANLKSVKHLHMNNNSLSGQIPPELSGLPILLHLLVDNNNLSGYLPSEFSMSPNLKILQLDNNNFNGSTIPASYGKMNALIKLSLRNCNLQGFIPDFSGSPELSYLDLSWNNLTGSIPSERLGKNVTTIKLANNQLQGTIPSSFSGLPLLQILSLSNNRLSGSVPSFIWPDKTSIGNRSLIFDFQNNLLTNITKTSDPPTNFSILLYGNPLCANPAQANLVNCQPQNINPTSGSTSSSRIICQACPKDSDYEYNPLSPIPCLCAIPLGVGYRLKSPGISDFHPYIEAFRVDLSSLLDLHPYQVYFDLYTWEEGPRLNIHLILFPDKTSLFNTSEVVRIRRMLTGWEITLSDVFGPYELLNFTLGSYANFEWWIQFGDGTPELQSFAIRVLGLTCSSSGCERNWSMYNQVHTKRRNRLSTLRMNSLVYIMYNRKLKEKNLWKKQLREDIDPLICDDIASDDDWFVDDVAEEITTLLLQQEDLAIDLFTLDRSTSSSHPTVLPTDVKSSLSKGALAGIVLGSIAAGAIISSTIVIFIMQKLSRHHVDSKRRPSLRTSLKFYDVKGFLLEEMKRATDNFSNSSLVGHGGYGKVYRGVLADGTVVAIKRAQEGSLQGSNEFATEIELLSRLHHRNLVSLVGYCDEDDEQMLIYEFMSNGNLRDHLSSETKEPLNFMMRIRIALETARGILYLHAEADPPIFHRDIKASNILLDSKYTAKVADFGISRLAPLPNVEGVSADHVSTVVKGTPGYLDPEYFLTHKLTDKSDVYSLGVVFMELLTGMQPISFGKNLVREVSMAYQSGRTFEIIDSRMGSYPSDCIDKFASLAYRCCQNQPDDRPPTSEIVRELENIWSMMPEADMLHPEPSSRDPERASAPLFSASSSSVSTNPYLSYDVFGSNLNISSIPKIKPR